ncbi:hypothetical protein V1264_018205 [Littorina saxatilis]|uniref:Equilibrative nucleoside transporter 1 n=1 Tax=Littorina saxatilis TaxID=31220 RepID=A0AAN9BD45_9CAEN
MQRKRHQPLSIPSEEEEDSDTAMEPDHDERESLLPQQCNNNSNSFLHKEPVDRFRVVYGIFLFLGVATLLPWNFFITAKHYFDFKFRNLTLPDGVPYDTGNVTTDLQTNFESYLSISSMLSNLVFITIAMLLVRHISLNCRMLVSLVPIIIIFIVTVVFVRIDTDSWQHGFFWFTLVSAAFMVGLTAVLTGSVFGLSCLFPPMYTQAVMSGQALGGTLSAVVMIVAIAIGGTPRNSAFWFFLTATVCSALAMGAYFALYRMKYSRFFMSNQGSTAVLPLAPACPYISLSQHSAWIAQDGGGVSPTEQNSGPNTPPSQCSTKSMQMIATAEATVSPGHGSEVNTPCKQHTPVSDAEKSPPAAIQGGDPSNLLAIGQLSSSEGEQMSDVSSRNPQGDAAAGPQQPKGEIDPAKESFAAALKSPPEKDMGKARVSRREVQHINADDVDKDVYEVNVEIPHSRELQSKTTYFTSILRKIWPYFMSVSLVFFVTLACFPAIVSLIKSSHYKPGDPWTATYFTPVVCFFIFNICDFIGRSATSWIKLPRNGQGGWLIFCALLRIGFLPLFMMCNIHPDKRKYLPVELADDVWPIVLNIALGLSNGYIGTLSMLYGPNNVELDQAEGAGMVMTFGMTLGLASGSVISLLLISLI